MGRLSPFTRLTVLAECLQRIAILSAGRLPLVQCTPTIIYETFQNFNCIYNSIPTYKKPFRDANYGWPTSTSLDDLYNTITTVAGFRLALENLCGRYSST